MLIHSLRLSNDGREEKMAHYELMTSEQVSQRFDRMEVINGGVGPRREGEKGARQGVD